jgi:hypothetical protein
MFAQRKQLAHFYEPLERDDALDFFVHGTNCRLPADASVSKWPHGFTRALDRLYAVPP